MHLLLIFSALLSPQDADSTAKQPSLSLSLVTVIDKAEGGLTEDVVIDVAVAGDGTVYVLRGDGTLRQYDGEVLRRTWGGKGTAPGQIQQPKGTAIGPEETVYVFDQAVNAISVFDSTGAFVKRKITPVRFIPFYSLGVDQRGFVYVGAFADEQPAAQIHVLCPEIECYVRALGEPRATRDSLAHRFFQSGYIDVGEEDILFAGLNPMRIENYQPSTGDLDTLVTSDLLPDAEPIAFTKEENGRFRITNWHPQTTGISRLGDGRIVYTAFFPSTASSVIRLYDSEGTLIGQADVPANMRVEGALPGGDVVMVRWLGDQEVAIYRLEEANEEG